jgi:SET domain-containing protein
VSQSLEDRVVVRDSGIHGRGLFAARRFRKNAYIATFEGKETSEDGMHVLWVVLEDESEVGIEGQNELRFLNHSSSPNAEFIGAELHALRNIEPGHEVTFHYGDEWEGVD